MLGDGTGERRDAQWRGVGFDSVLLLSLARQLNRCGRLGGAEQRVRFDGRQQRASGCVASAAGSGAFGALTRADAAVGTAGAGSVISSSSSGPFTPSGSNRDGVTGRSSGATPSVRAASASR